MSQIIVESGTKQYLVSAGEKINVDRLAVEIDDIVELPVLFSFANASAVATTVKAKVIAHKKGEKLRIVKFRNKSNYHKQTGYRHFLTTLEIL
jgi:large subunit ribosomal protein L21